MWLQEHRTVTCPKDSYLSILKIKAKKQNKQKPPNQAVQVFSVILR